MLAAIIYGTIGIFGAIGLNVLYKIYLKQNKKKIGIGIK